MINGVDLHDLVANDGLEFVFQPIFDFSRGAERRWGVEALTRGPRGTGFEAANVLFDYVRLKHEEAAMDRYCVKKALSLAAALPRDLRVSVNVHAVTIEKDEEFADFVAGQAQMNGIDPSRLVLEMVEQSRYWSIPCVLRGVNRLRDHGMALALDDIGCGHCNYRMIVDLQPDYLKLDRYFVQGCAHERSRRAVLKSVHGLARDIGAEVIAEGVETADELQTIKNIGVRLAQGFRLGKPVPAQELAPARGNEVCV